MTIYIIVLYICIEAKCQFFQAEGYITDEKECKREVAAQIEKGKREGVKVDGTCIDLEVQGAKRV